MIRDGDTIRFLEKIQENLTRIDAGVADPYNREYKINDDKTELLEEEIDRLTGLFICRRSPHYLGLVACLLRLM